MYTRIIEELKDKKIIILGFGIEGKSTYNFIRADLPNQFITIADSNIDLAQNNPFLNDDKNISLVLGDDYFNGLEQYDLIIKSPGVCIKDLDIPVLRSKLTSQAELFLKYFTKNTIGVTGSKGKSTTSSLIYHIIKEHGADVRLLGNIGTAIFEDIKQVNDDTIFVLELACDQLTYVDHSPHIGIWLNVFQEHLDHFNTYQDYIDAKTNIYKYQSKDDYFIYNDDNQELLDNVIDPKANKYTFSISNSKKGKDNYLFLEGEELFISKNKQVNKLFNINESRNLIGKHNLNNIMAAFAVADIYHYDNESVIKSIKTFKTLPHRLEFIGTFNDVSYYDDSISTIPESCIAAIETIPLVDTIIIGGKDRGIDYTKLIDYINNNNVGNVICMPTSGHLIADQVTNNNIIKVADLKEAVEQAVKVTKKGHACVLSPAASSYGFFKNFVERGNEFQRLVKELN